MVEYESPELATKTTLLSVPESAALGALLWSRGSLFERPFDTKSDKIPFHFFCKLPRSFRSRNTCFIGDLILNYKGYNFGLVFTHIDFDNPGAFSNIDGRPLVNIAGRDVFDRVKNETSRTVIKIVCLFLILQ